jgi:hypothetical protein
MNDTNLKAMIERHEYESVSFIITLEFCVLSQNFCVFLEVPMENGMFQIKKQPTTVFPRKKLSEYYSNSSAKSH